MWIDWSLFQFPCRFESTLVVKIWLTGGEFDSATFRFNNWNCWKQTGPSRHATLAHYICTLKHVRLLNWPWISVIHLLLVSLFPPAVVSVVFLIVAHPLGFVFPLYKEFHFSVRLLIVDDAYHLCRLSQFLCPGRPRQSPPPLLPLDKGVLVPDDRPDTSPHTCAVFHFHRVAVGRDTTHSLLLPVLGNHWKA